MSSGPVKKTMVYQDKQGQWRWTALARNGRKLADSSEGYRNRGYAQTMATKLFPHATPIDW